MKEKSNIIPTKQKVTRENREERNKHKSVVLWFTGLSGSGKSSVSQELNKRFFDMGVQSYVLDGDNIRMGLNKDIGFTDQDRTENIRRIAEVSSLFVDAGFIILTAFISPFRKDRKFARSLTPPGSFIEIYVDCPLETCEARDVKGLYQKARNGEIKNYTGIDSPYEPPSDPDIHLKTNEITLDQSVDEILSYLRNKKII